MKHKPWYQLLLNSYLRWLIVGITVISSIGDTIYNLIVIPPFITYLGTVLIILGLTFGYYILPKHPIRWVSEDGGDIYITSLNFGTWIIAGGLIIALWFPRVVGNAISAPSSIPTSVPTASSVPSPISTYPEDCFGYEMLQDWLQAEECYKQKIIKDPYNFEALDNLARVYGVNGQHAESIEIAKNMIWLADTAEEHLEAIETLGVQQYYLGDYASAINTLLQSADYYDSQNPRSVEISLWLAKSYNANGDKKKACEQYQLTLTLAQQQNYEWGIENAQSGLSNCP